MYIFLLQVESTGGSARYNVADRGCVERSKNIDGWARLPLAGDGPSILRQRGTPTFGRFLRQQAAATFGLNLRRLAAAASACGELGKSGQLVHLQVGDRGVFDAVLAPEDQVETLAGLTPELRVRCAGCGPGEQVDHMLTAAIHHRCPSLATEVGDSPADQLKPLGAEVDHRRRDIQPRR